MDAADRALDEQDAELASHLDRQRRAAALQKPGNELCADCGTEIPLERRRALPSAIRCVECQEWAERLRRTHA